MPNCKKLGLLDAGDGWLRDRFTELGVIQFEDWVDTGEEYAQLDEVAKDRAVAFCLTPILLCQDLPMTYEVGLAETADDKEAVYLVPVLRVRRGDGPLPGQRRPCGRRLVEAEDAHG